MATSDSEMKGGNVKRTFGMTLLVGMLATTRILGAQSDNKRPGSATQKVVKSTYGSISGRIFLITKGGDLKPARMARVYLFWENGADAHAVTAAGGGDAPGLIYLKRYLEATEDANKSEASQYCNSSLLNADRAVSATLDWAREHKLTAYVEELNADEEGTFNASKMKPGLYELVVRGEAGINDAYWLQQVRVTAGENTEVKVSSVEASCATDEP
jgi:hypothetical protein